MVAFLAVALTALRWLLFSRGGFLIMAAFTWLGINFATVNLIIQPTIQALENFAGGGGGAGGGEYYDIAKQWAGVLNFDKALTMVISAYTTRTILMNGRLFLWKTGATQS